MPDTSVRPILDAAPHGAPVLEPAVDLGGVPATDAPDGTLSKGTTTVTGTVADPNRTSPGQDDVV